MDEKNNKKQLKRLYVEPSIGEAFIKHCKANNIKLLDAINVILNFVTINNINPDDFEYVWNKKARIELRDARKSLLETHNYTVGFLKTFELNLNENLKKYNDSNNLRYVNLLTIINQVLTKNEIEKVTIGEILYDLQLLIKLEDEVLGAKIVKENWDKIIKKEKELK